MQSCFAQLRHLTKIRSFFSSADLEKVIHAFISSRLDNCNTLYSGINRWNIQRLQLIQNAAAWFLTRTKRCDHVTPILAALHWLPGSFRVDFKILQLVFKALNGQSPAYLCDLLTLYEPDRCLGSSSRDFLMFQNLNLSLKVTGPLLFLPLGYGTPGDLRQVNSVSSFKSLLKTHFYLMAFS